MINKLNLASRPFRNRTLPYLISIWLLALALIGTIFGFAMLRNITAKDELVQSDINQMQAEMAQLRGEGEKVQQSLTPEQRALLVASHKLVAQKSFAWSRLLADLETVVPGSVSVSRINVQNIYDTGDRTQAELEFGVLSRNYQSVMNMIDAMNSSGVFRAELRGQDLQKTESFTYSEYTLRLIYLPRTGYTTTPSDTIASTNGQGGAR